jgi:hypothetical protein
VTGQVLSADGGASMVNSVRPTGGAGAWDTDAVDRVVYGTSVVEEVAQQPSRDPASVRVEETQ